MEQNANAQSANQALHFAFATQTIEETDDTDRLARQKNQKTMELRLGYQILGQEGKALNGTEEYFSTDEMYKH